MHRVRERQHPEDVQEQIFIPAARLPVPRGAATEGFPLPRVLQRVLQAGQDEESHEDHARLLRAQGLCVSDERFLHDTRYGGPTASRY